MTHPYRPVPPPPPAPPWWRRALVDLLAGLFILALAVVVVLVPVQ